MNLTYNNKTINENWYIMKLTKIMYIKLCKKNSAKSITLVIK